MKRLHVLLALLLATATVLAGCGELLEPAAAVVHGDKITVDTIQAAVDEFVATDAFEQQSQQGDPDALKRVFEQGYLTQLIQRAVLEPEAEARGLEVTDADLQERMDLIAGDFPSQSAFEEAVREQGLTLDQLQELVYDQLIEERLREEIVADVTPSDDELLGYYENHPKDYRQTRAQHILVEDRALAAQLSAQLRGAPAKGVERAFDRLAAEHSTDASNAKSGGDLGYFVDGDLVPPFQKAADALEEGQVSEPVKTEFGFHVIRVIDRRTQPFEEVREEILDRLAGGAQEEAWSEWLTAEYEEADIKVNPRYGEFDLAAQQVVDASAESLPGAEIPAEGDATPPQP